MTKGLDLTNRLHASPVRIIWRSLPRSWRQGLYGRLTSLGCPDVEPMAHVRITEPVTVVGPLRAPTGLGQAARLALHAMHRSGIACHSLDLTQALLQPSGNRYPELPPATAGAGTLLVYVTPPNAARALKLVPEHIRLGKTLVAAWVCETTRLPAIWRRQARHFHALVAPTPFCVEVLKAETQRNVGLLGHPVDAEPVAPLPLRPARPHRVVGAVLDVGSSAKRKDVEGLIEALSRVLSRSSDITVRLKVRDITSDPIAQTTVERLRQQAPGRVEAVAANDDRAETIRFIDSLDVLLTMSRAEGFGLSAIEAIARNVIVIAPRWGGAADLLDDSNSIPLPFRLVPIDDPAGLYSPAMGLWAEVNPEDAACAVLNAPRNKSAKVPELATTKHFVDQLEHFAIRSRHSLNF